MFKMGDYGYFPATRLMKLADCIHQSICPAHGQDNRRAGADTDTVNVLFLSQL